MKVVLVVPGSVMVQDMSPAARRLAMFMPPLGMVGLATYLNEHDIETTIVDAVRDNLDPAQCAEAIAAQQPGLVGVSVLTFSYHYVVQLSAALRKRLPGVPIVMGNLHAALFRERILTQGEADYVVVGEGEQTLLDLARGLAAGEVGDIPGLSRRNGDGWRDGPLGGCIADLDSLPRPDWSLIDIAWYMRSTLPFLREPMMSISTARGCPYNCTFCSQDKWNRVFRHRSISSLLDEMEWLHERWDSRLVGIIDGTFPWTIPEGHEFCGALRERGLEKRMRWVCESRLDQISPELLREMAAAGCAYIMYGFESGDQHMLDAMNKGTNVEHNLAMARATRAAGIDFHAFFIMGYPGETVQSARRTIRYALKTGATTLKVHLAMPMPGSAFYEQVRDQIDVDFADPESSRGFSSWNNWSLLYGKPVYVPDGMSARTLMRLYWLAHLAFYGRPWKLAALLARGIMRPGTLWAGAKVFLAGILSRGRKK